MLIWMRQTASSSKDAHVSCDEERVEGVPCRWIALKKHIHRQHYRDTQQATTSILSRHSREEEKQDEVGKAKYPTNSEPGLNGTRRYPEPDAPRLNQLRRPPLNVGGGKAYEITFLTIRRSLSSRVGHRIGICISPDDPHVLLVEPEHLESHQLPQTAVKSVAFYMPSGGTSRI